MKKEQGPKFQPRILEVYIGPDKEPKPFDLVKGTMLFSGPLGSPYCAHIGTVKENENVKAYPLLSHVVAGIVSFYVQGVTPGYEYKFHIANLPGVGTGFYKASL